jgi:hypothetical protein
VAKVGKKPVPSTKTVSTGYVANGQIPKAGRPGLVLCHNHVGHTKDTTAGDRGFRAWWEKECPEGFVLCDCGWSGLPHYAAKGRVETAKAKKK